MPTRSQNENGSPPGHDVEYSQVVLSQVIMPVHAGPGGIFAHGGEIIKLMDTAAGLVALRHCRSQVVTLRVESINFIQPIRVGNFITVTARLTYVSRATMEIQVTVTAEHVLKAHKWKALSAYFVFVALDEKGEAKAVPPLIVTTEEEQRLHEAGQERHDTCRIDEHSKTLCAID